MIRSYDGQHPKISESAYVDPDATVIGDVRIQAEATVLPGAVLRADGGGTIDLYERANVQDNATLHADAPDERIILEENAAVGHNAIVHNAAVGHHSLIGMNATVLDDAVIEPYSIVGANSLVREDQRVDSYTLVGGTPASILREGLDEDDDTFDIANRYTERVDGLVGNVAGDG